MGHFVFLRYILNWNKLLSFPSIESLGRFMLTIEHVTSSVGITGLSNFNCRNLGIIPEWLQSFLVLNKSDITRCK